jgi:rhamnogalacturonan endolyase
MIDFHKAKDRDMNRKLLSALLVCVACSSQRLDAVTPYEPSQGNTAGHFQMEGLNRGVVAVQVKTGVYVGWRMFGTEYDPENSQSVFYNVYRDGAKIASVVNSTNYLDAVGNGKSTYSVRAVVAGLEQEDSGSADVWATNYLRVPLTPPPAGATPNAPLCENPAEGYAYDANDGTVGDLNGDHDYEIVLKWEPTNERDNSQSGCTGNVYVDAYQLDGTLLWRIDLGVNIRAGAHYTQVLVYDFDGDGKAEVVMRTAPGTKAGTGLPLHLGPAAIDDQTKDYRSIGNPGTTTGLILTGPEYLTVFDGATGVELATVPFEPARGDPFSWGDTVGARVDLFLSSAGFLNDLGQGKVASGRPSIVVSRGYFDRAAITAWNWRAGQLTKVWQLDSSDPTGNYADLAGQGAESMAMAMHPSGLSQQLIFGAATIDSDGTLRCTTGFGNGAALHVGDLVPDRPGLEVFMPHDSGLPIFDVRDSDTCEVISTGPMLSGAAKRGVADDVSPLWPGAEVWTSNSGGVASAMSGKVVDPNTIPPTNFLIYWDADESRELEDGTAITKYDGTLLQGCTPTSTCASNNSTKSTPVLTADLFGDWREEIIWREATNKALRIYTTTDVTTRRLFTLMHDPQYRMQVTSEQSGYNQPPHPSFHIGTPMVAPPKPDIYYP